MVETYRVIAQRCIDVIICLKKDICKVKSNGIFLTDIELKFIAKHISSALLYAYRYWVGHTEQGGWEIGNGGAVDQFLCSKFLFWLEAMVWLGQYYEAVRMILKLKRLISVS